MCSGVMRLSAVLSRYTSVQRKHTTPKNPWEGLWCERRGISTLRLGSIVKYFSCMSVISFQRQNNLTKLKPSGRRDSANEFDSINYFLIQCNSLFFFFFLQAILHLTPCSVSLFDNIEQNQINKPDNSFSVFAHRPHLLFSFFFFLFAHLNVCHFIPVCVLERERDIPQRCADHEQSAALQNTSIKEKIKIGCFL